MSIRLTEKDINETIVHAQYHHFPGTTLTACCLTLRNGFAVLGESACIDPASFNAALGEAEAFKSAREKVWALEGYWIKGLLAMSTEAEAEAQALRLAN
ncbi:Gp49 family protein [Thauera aromatica]|uniref:Gp49 family protein n=1 Tax=Thauera aromatica TaxID=59405 RepID=UPI001FFC8FCE|nr:Gp49 family protein [Thauera aromatica]MCK2097531.1 Gp49 family protein [Thauera aromatica]